MDLSTKVTELMTSPVKCIMANWTLGEAVKFFIDNNFTGAPVCDESGRDSGVLTFKDVVQYTHMNIIGEAAEQMGQVRVEHIMSRGVEAVSVDATVRDVLDKLLSRHFHRVFVRDKAGKLCGVISTLDIIRWMKLNS